MELTPFCAGGAPWWSKLVLMTLGAGGAPWWWFLALIPEGRGLLAMNIEPISA